MELLVAVACDLDDIAERILAVAELAAVREGLPDLRALLAAALGDPGSQSCNVRRGHADVEESSLPLLKLIRAALCDRGLKLE